LWTRLSAAQRLLNALLLIVILAFVHPQIALMGLIWHMGVAIHYLPRLPIEIPFVLRWSTPAAVLVCAATLIWCKGTRFTLADYILGIAVSGLIYAVLSCSRTSMPSAYNWTADALSRSSYTLYRVHVPFLVFLNAWIGQARWIPTPGHKLIGCAIFAVVMLYAQWPGSFLRSALTFYALGSSRGFWAARAGLVKESGVKGNRAKQNHIPKPSHRLSDWRPQVRSAAILTAIKSALACARMMPSRFAIRASQRCMRPLALTCRAVNSSGINNGTGFR
jgi:hypothetical protein